MPLASVALDEARILLNDVGATLYTNTILLPYLKKAYRELQQQLADNGVSVTREQSSALTLAANVTVLNSSSTPALPTDLLYPITLEEKLSGESDINYIPMQEVEWIDNFEQTERLQVWSWRENEIKLNGATGTTLVRIRYFKSLAAIVDSTTNIPILDSETFLGSRTAALAAFTIGGSVDKATVLSTDAESALATLLSTQVKNRQNQPVRRKRFRSFRTRWGW